MGKPTTNGTRPDGSGDRNGNFTPETIAYLQRRTEEFVQMTSGKGKPMTFGQKKADK